MLEKQFKLHCATDELKLSIAEFKKSIRDYRLEVTDQEIQFVFDYFDKGSLGSINYLEFMDALRGKLTEQRLNVINRVFEKLDSNDSDDFITFSDMLSNFQARLHPDVKNQRRHEQEVF